MTKAEEKALRAYPVKEKIIGYKNGPFIIIDINYEERIKYQERLERLQPYLPSNLDEAAEEFGKRQGLELAPFGRKFVKAGAKWLSKQGVSMEITDETEWADVDNFVHRNCDGATVIQIRKKEE